MEYYIRPVTEDEYPRCVEVIRSAFLTVAEDFNLTKENTPTNPAFIELKHVDSMRDRGIHMYGLFTGNIQAGFAALEKLSGSDYEMKRLAVTPEFRHNGYGKALVRHLAGIAKSEGGERIKIGVVNENAVLKEWYLKLGFAETAIKIYENLPFTVCLMELAL